MSFLNIRYRLFPFLLLAAAMLTPFPAAAGDAVGYELENGLKVILIEEHRAPVASILVWVKVGSASENQGEFGLAHLMEHMVFKGTHDRAPGEIAREIEASGGKINAYTTYDQTVYYIDIASRYLSRGLDVMTDMVFNPALDPDEFAREKEVVIEEIRRGRDMPARVLSKGLFRTAFQTHPYSRPIIGFEESVAGIDLETAKNFHRKWYRPENTILVVSGDFRPETIRPLIQDLFGPIGSEGPKPADLRPVEPVQTQTRVVVLRDDVETARLYLGFHMPEFKSRQADVLDLLAGVLGQGRTSRLYTKVKREKELVHSISTWTYTPRDPGLFLISAQLDPEQVLPSLEAILSETARMGREEAERAELERVLLSVEASLIGARETMSGEARLAANFEGLAGDFRKKDNYLQQLEEIDLRDLRRAAAERLRPENMTVAVLLPQKAAPGVTEEAILAVTAKAADEFAPPPSPLQAEELKTYTLSNGIRLAVKADRTLPLTAIRAAFLGGVRYEPRDLSGLNNFLAEVWDKGAGRYDARELALAVEDMAAELEPFSGRNSFGLRAEFLTRFLDQGLDLFGLVLADPTFAASEVEKSRPLILAEIKRQEESPAARAFNLFTKTLYQDHPYGRRTLGEPETVAKISADDIKAFYDRYAKPENLVIVAVGDVDPDELKDKLEKRLGDWTGQVENHPKPRPQPTPQGLIQTTEDLDRAQTHIVLGFPAPGLADEDRFALEVLDKIFSGQSGRMFIQLRDKESLAYSLNSFYSPGLNAGSFGFYLACDPAKKDRARQGLRELISGIRENPVTAEELAAAKEYILGAYEIGLQKYGAQAAELTFNILYDLGADYQDRYVAGIEAVTPEDIRQAADRYLNLETAVEILVGPEEK